MTDVMRRIRRNLTFFGIPLAYVFGVGATMAYLSATGFGNQADSGGGETGLYQTITALVWPLWLFWRVAGYVGRAFV